MKFPALLLAYASRLRFPWLLALTGALFLLSLLLPDPIPLLDEVLLGLLTLLFAAWRRRGRPDDDQSDSSGAGDRRL